LTREEFVAALSDEFTRQKRAKDLAEASGDVAGAREAIRRMKDFAQILRLAMPKDAEDDQDVIRVRMDDVHASAERALADLKNMAEEVRAERAGWPRCEKCGQPCGAFEGSGEKSVVRGLFEKAAG
jgi:hypothetical protein